VSSDTVPDRVVGAVAAERAACVAFLREKASALRGMADGGRVPRGEAEMSATRIGTIADGIETGLHVFEGENS
jgi:hypothetical protein